MHVFQILRVGFIVLAGLAMYVIGASLIHKFTIPSEPEPEPGELRSVDLRYRCAVCGAEVTMTAAPGEEEPAPPRHCREDMELVAQSQAPPTSE